MMKQRKRKEKSWVSHEVKIWIVMKKVEKIYRKKTERKIGCKPK